MTRARLLLALLLLAGAGAPAPAQAYDVVLAPAANAAGITAYAGQVLFSRRDPATGNWALVRWHAGVMDVLPVAQRAVPFDADAGPDANDSPVVVYSRCRREPAPSIGLPPSPDWQTARGCDLYGLTLTGTPVEHKLAAASSRTQSETTPSIWRGGVAFARHADGAHTPRLLYLPNAATRPRPLGGGSVQTCDGLCAFADVHDSVDQLDIGPSRAVVLWRMTGGAVYGTGLAWELRAGSLKGGQSTLLDTGLISGACGFSLPNGATATAGSISFNDAGSPCDVTETSFVTVDPVTGARGLAPTPGGLAVATARDGDTIFWLRAAAGQTENVPIPGSGSCSVATARCELVASSLPAYAPQPARRQSPPGNIDVIRSGLGYRWVAGPGATQLLRPPARLPCAPSSQPAYVYTAARWSRGRHAVQVLRSDPGKPARNVGSPQTRTNQDGYYTGPLRLERCGSRTRVTYVVKTGGRSQRVSFAVARAT